MSELSQVRRERRAPARARPADTAPPHSPSRYALRPSKVEVPRRMEARDGASVHVADNPPSSLVPRARSPPVPSKPNLDSVAPERVVSTQSTSGPHTLTPAANTSSCEARRRARRMSGATTTTRTPEQSIATTSTARHVAGTTSRRLTIAHFTQEHGGEGWEGGC